MDAATKYQQQLLDQTRQIYHRTPISDATADAFLTTPRHLFVSPYERLLVVARASGWRTHLIVLLGGDAGLRCGEMVALQWLAVRDDFRNWLVTAV